MSTRGRRFVAGEGDAITVEAESGESWHDLVAWTIARGYGGLENLAGIPGTAGAAPIQNIGAYGVELADRFASLVAFDAAERTLCTFDWEQCQFGYRDSIFKRRRGHYIVVSVRLTLPRNWVPVLSYSGLSSLERGTALNAGSVMRAVVSLRGQKLPDWRVSPNVGSFFHNPIVSAAAAATMIHSYPSAPVHPLLDGRVKLSAAWLIEQSGLKGLRMGPVGVSDRHALVLINLGGGTQADFVRLSSRIKQEVLARFGVPLVEEPEFLDATEARPIGGP